MKKFASIKVVLVAAIAAISLTAKPAAATQSVTLGPLSATVNSASFSYSKANGVQLSLDLNSTTKLAGHSINLDLNNLMVNKSGIEDATISVGSATGTAALLDQTIGGIDVKLNSASVVIHNNKVQSVTFGGSFSADGMTLNTNDLTIASDGSASGTLTLAGSTTLAGVTLKAQTGGNISFSVNSDGSNFAISLNKMTLDFSSIITGLSIDLDTLSYNNGAFNASISTSKTLTLDWVNITANSMTVTSPKPATGASRVVTVNMTGSMSATLPSAAASALGKSSLGFTFTNLVASSDGTVSGNIGVQ